MNSDKNVSANGETVGFDKAIELTGKKLIYCEFVNLMPLAVLMKC